MWRRVSVMITSTHRIITSRTHVHGRSAPNDTARHCLIRYARKYHKHFIAFLSEVNHHNIAKDPKLHTLATLISFGERMMSDTKQGMTKKAVPNTTTLERDGVPPMDRPFDIKFYRSRCSRATCVYCDKQQALGRGTKKTEK